MKSAKKRYEVTICLTCEGDTPEEAIDQFCEDLDMQDYDDFDVEELDEDE